MAVAIGPVGTHPTPMSGGFRDLPGSDRQGISRALPSLLVPPPQAASESSRHRGGARSGPIKGTITSYLPGEQMRVMTVLLIAIAVFAPRNAMAQVVVGDRLRVEMVDGEALDGVVSSLSARSIFVRDAGTGPELEIPYTEIRSLERSLGKQRRFGKNLGVTMVISAGTLGVGSAIAWSPCTGLCLVGPNSRGEAFAWGAVGGTLVGLPLGVVVGLARKSEQWEPLSIPGTEGAAIRLVPVIGAGLGVAGSISFGGL